MDVKKYFNRYKAPILVTVIIWLMIGQYSSLVFPEQTSTETVETVFVPNAAEGGGLQLLFSGNSEAKKESEYKQRREEIGLDEDGLLSVMSKMKGLYAYEHLSDQGKTLYAEIYRIFITRSEEILISSTNTNVIDTTCNYVLADHPEIFWVNGYTYTKRTSGDKIKHILFSGNYVYNKTEILQKQTLINKEVEMIARGVPAGSDYDKAKYIYEYVIKKTIYDPQAEDNQNIISVFLNGRSVCQGYAKTIQYLLNYMKIPCTLVSGVAGGVNHVWDLAYIDGEYTYIDATWGDTSYQTADKKTVSVIDYSYLCATYNDMATTHSFSNILAVPQNTNGTNSYFVHEGTYLKTYDKEQVQKIFDNSYKKGQNSVQLKCSSKTVFNEILDDFIENNKIFDYMEEGEEDFSYTIMEEKNVIIIWL